MEEDLTEIKKVFVVTVKYYNTNAAKFERSVFVVADDVISMMEILGNHLKNDPNISDWWATHINEELIDVICERKE